jgi:hypothetical protein
MKKLLLFRVLSISILLSSHCFAYKANPTDTPLELTKSAIMTTTDDEQEIEVLLWQELIVYSLIVGSYAAWWLRQKA